MRGSHGTTSGTASTGGIIPAHAGLTTLIGDEDIARRDHPRACGAHPAFSPATMRSTGSSPRMRGSHKQGTDITFDDGIIPAHAGLTQCFFVKPKKTWDHPRACGAHSEASASSDVRLGSSPRMRGSRCMGACDPCREGIIPAHAGLTVKSEIPNTPEGDHPRACGAHNFCSMSLMLIAGSSPRMRGSHLRAHNRYRQLGIIPAHAGLTENQNHRELGQEDHPRACGAHCIKRQSESTLPRDHPRACGAHQSRHRE